MTKRHEKQDWQKSMTIQGHCNPNISESDVIAAMKTLPGHIDITPGDFKEIYQVAYAAALARLAKTSKAKDIMTKPVYTIGLKADLQEIAALMARRAISGAPVVDDAGKVVGVISEKDIFLKLGAEQTGSFMEVVASWLKTKQCAWQAFCGLTASDLMSTPAITARADILAEEISDIFTLNQVNRLPIIDADGKPIGIVTRNDLVKSICRIG